jgi:hypothetical protein
MERLGPDEIDALLRSVGYGFLGLAADDVPYVLPMSFGYDGDALYFQTNSTGRKFDFLSPGSRACVAVLSVDPERSVSRSVLVRGPVGEVTDREAALGALADNAEFGTDLSLWGAPLGDVETALHAVRAEERSGRRFGEQHAP